MLFFILLATVLVTNAYGNDNPCPDGWHHYDGTCIKRFDTRKSFIDARAVCQEENGDLVKIRSRDQNMFVTELVMDNGANWIGLWDESKKRRYSYVDGTRMQFAAWNRGEPNNSNGNEHCVMLYGDAGPRTGRWNDAPCTEALPFVCSIEFCPDGWSYYEPDNMCIGVRHTPRPFNNAREECQDQGGDLMQIKNDDQKDFILRLARHPRYWMGVFDDDDNQKFNYIDGSELGAYHPWFTGEPNNYGGKEHCGMLYITGPGRGKWNDATCASKQPYICSSQSSLTQCPTGWVYYEPDQACAKLFDTPATFSSAKETCMAEDAHLARIKNEAEEEFILDLGIPVRNWIGVSHDEKTDKFTYTDGSELGEYQPWNEGEPNNHGGHEKCGMMYGSDSAGNWNDDPCSRRYPFICSTQSNTCPEGWSYHAADNKCMKNFDMALTFNDARKACQKADADLVQIKNEAQNKFVLSLGIKNSWIGLSDEKHEKHFVYIDGTALGDYHPWFSREPNNYGGNEDCAMIYASGVGKARWNDAPCSAKLQFVCSKEVNHCPTGWSYYEPDNMCLKNFKEPQTFTNARKTCVAKDGDLVHIKNDAQKDFIVSLDIQQLNWIGVSKNGEQFSYVDGSELGDYQPWNKGEPNNAAGNEKCVMIYGHLPTTGKWNDASCSEHYPFICVKNKKIPHCREGWRYYEPDNMCVKIFNTPKPFHEARETCQAEHGDLMQIKNDGQKDFVLGSEHHRGHWIGVARKGQKFIYMDGSAFGDYHPWFRGEPNNYGGAEFCGMLYGSGPGRGQWNDAPCHNLLTFVCSAEAN